MRITRSFLAYFQLVLLGAILVSNALFMHSHVSHGHLVMHVHPYAWDNTKDDVPAHEHSDDEMVFYDFLAHQGIVQQESLAAILEIIPCVIFAYDPIVADEGIVRYPYHDSPTLRGPPAIRHHLFS
ncbi:hypothetical protein ACFSQ3_13790 [Sphingobacterium corticis]|uniref:Uncharacterized protein n=1 Tax=Sphingobacterium corticis TaxID=1812823 RepID=A0ABW5NPU1_9SPHI